MRTQVAIVGAGPAGLLLGHLLHQAGIATVILEIRDRDYVLQRIRAGVLEQGSVEVLRAAGVGQRMDREGLVHHGIHLNFDGRRHRIDMHALTGRSVMVYGQTQIVEDLILAREGAAAPLHFSVEDVSVQDVEGARPKVRFREKGEARELHCDYIAGCDGFHGICRPSIPQGVLTFSERDYPFAWLGIMARVAPSSDELVYTHHERGFALLSMRSPSLSRLYLQCHPDDDLANWPDHRIWQELHERVENRDGWTLQEGPVFDKSITPMRSFVCEPMQYGKLFLAGDAAHIVPPTGAKGLNLALADVKVLADALIARYTGGETKALNAYSETCLRRVWRAEHFSWWMTSMLHRFEDDDGFQRQLQLSQLRYVVSSIAAATSLAENYTGLPFERTRSAGAPS